MLLAFIYLVCYSFAVITVAQSIQMVLGLNYMSQDFFLRIACDIQSEL